MTLAEALAGKDIPEKIKNDLALVAVQYVSFDRGVCTGELVVHKDLAGEVTEIFEMLLKLEFPIEKIEPIAAYGWDDDASMAANNSSAFNYRTIAGTDRLSYHSYGRAIDINPLQNPYIQHDGKVVPPGARYDLAQPGTVTPAIASVFTSLGWHWGGDWREHTDWQHFEKP
jgi:hypothetical protein